MYKESTYRIIHRFSLDKGIYEVKDLLVEERIFDLLINGQYCERLVCTPTYLEELVVGHLALTGVIKTSAEIRNLEINDQAVQVETMIHNAPPFSGGVSGQVKCYAEDIVEVMEKHLNSSELHKITGGVHIMSLAKGKELLVSREDIGRHNAVDKIYGHCLINDLDCRDKLFLSSGRISNEILQKILVMGIKVVVGRAAVTSLARDIADREGLTVIGFARGPRFNIYTHPERILIRK